MAAIGIVSSLLGAQVGAECTARVPLDHGDVSKSAASKPWYCFIRLSLLRAPVHSYVESYGIMNRQRFLDQSEKPSSL